MGRSGTSLVASVLRECGVFFGAPDDLFAPDVHNRDGYGEHARIVGLNDALLEALGGSWNGPPARMADWELDRALDPLAASAREIVETLAPHSPWGWKDPRTSLTLPFWRRLVGDLHIVVCVRHPEEVTRSLAVRDGMPREQGLKLWLAYNRTLLTDVPSERRIVVHYDAFFSDRRRALDRLVAFFELDPSPLQRARALETVNEALRNHAAPAPADEAGRLPRDVADCYRELMNAASSQTPRPNAEFNDPADGHAELEAAREILRESRQRIYMLQDRLAFEERERAEIVAQLEHEVAGLKTELDARVEELKRMQERLHVVHNSRSFRWTRPLRRLGRLLRNRSAIVLKLCLGA